MLGAPLVCCALVIGLLLEVACLPHLVLKMARWLSFILPLSPEPIELLNLPRRTLLLLSLCRAIDRFEDVRLVGTLREVLLNLS